MKLWRIGLPGLVLGVLATVALVTQLDLEQLAASLQGARHGWLVPAFLLLLAGQGVRALRWRALLHDSLPVTRAFNILNISYLANAFLPLRLGELARLWLVRPRIPSLQAAGSVLLERMLDSLAVLLLLSAAISVIPGAGAPYREAARLMFPTLLLLAAMLYLLAQRRSLSRRLMRAFLCLPVPALVRRLPLAAWLEALLDGLQPLTQPALLLRALALTTLAWLLSLLASCVLIMMFYEQSSLAAAALGLAAAALVIALPAVPGNIGTYQWAIMLSLAAAGYGKPTDVANASLGIVIHAINLFMYILTGSLGLALERVTPASLIRSLASYRIRQEQPDLDRE